MPQQTQSLVQHYESALPIWIKKDGFPVAPLLALHHDNTVTMASLMIPQQMIFTTAVMKFMTDITVKELVFGVDRFTKPGQGTKYKDVLTVFWWQGERIENYGFRFGVINYRPPPKQIIEPIDWNNTFWNDIMLKIVEEFYSQGSQKIQAFADAGGAETIDELRDTIREARDRVMRGQKPS